MRSWLAALRIARREARRARGRSTLVMALIGLPVLALSFAAVTYDSFRLTPDQDWRRQHGTADARLAWWYDGPVTQSPELETTGGRPRIQPATTAEVRAVVPGGRVVPSPETWLAVHTPDGVADIQTRGIDLADPIVEGMVTVRTGRAPRDLDEVALTEQAADWLGVSIGDTVRAADERYAYRVVGMVEFATHLDQQLLMLPAAIPPDQLPSAYGWLWDAPGPVTWEQVRELNRHGLVVDSRAVRLDPPSPGQVPMPARMTGGNTEAVSVGLVGGGLGLLEVVLLAGPAFAVGARRRARDLALVAANGGNPAHLRRIMLADGVVLGIGGAAVGIVLGTVLAVAAQPLLETEVWNQRAGGYRFFPPALLGIAGLAVVTGVLAALVPAFLAARVPVVAALAGRRGTVRSRRRWLVLGLVMVGVGGTLAVAGAWQAVTGLIFAGLVIGELGLVLCTPAMVGLLARAARFLPLGPRIALRDTARNRAAAAPAISAVMAAVAGSLALGVFMASDDARHQVGYRPAGPIGSAVITYDWSMEVGGEFRAFRLAPEDQERVRATVVELFPARQLFDVSVGGCARGAPAAECGLFVELPRGNQCPFWSYQGELSREQQRAAAADERCRMDLQWAGFSLGQAIVDDGTDLDRLRMLTGAGAADVAATAAALRAGRVVVTNPLLVEGGEATVVGYRQEGSGTTAVAVANRRVERRSAVPAVVMTGATTPDLSLIPPGAARAVGLEPVVHALLVETTPPPTREQEEALTAALHEIQPDLWLYVERGPGSINDPLLLLLAGVAAAVALGAAGIATGLAAADRRGDLSTLGAVGASPRVRRMLALSQSGVIAGLGTLLGVAAGCAAGAAVLIGLNHRQDELWPSPELFPITLPWSTLAVIALVPVVAMLGAGLFTRSRLPIERRRL